MLRPKSFILGVFYVNNDYRFSKNLTFLIRPNNQLTDDQYSRALLGRESQTHLYYLFSYSQLV